ncbi:hypothetical protein IEQ34_026529 [Dendrobium chrysotoxum]|uniref:Uncharacterized protein n=1 Tax=Dendrobium chrysotoxum TaxID=161865 RepID=A0AAV7FMM2_DENCH|nr:hypothetical protein IEQ34_026529 [Dendrobium chrysotoxum]
MLPPIWSSRHSEPEERKKSIEKTRSPYQCSFLAPPKPFRLHPVARSVASCLLHSPDLNRRAPVQPLLATKADPCPRPERTRSRPAFAVDHLYSGKTKPSPTWPPTSTSRSQSPASNPPTSVELANCRTNAVDLAIESSDRRTPCPCPSRNLLPAFNPVCSGRRRAPPPANPP